MLYRKDNTEQKEIRICRRCLLRDLAERDSIEMLEKYKNAIRREDRTAESAYESRLAVCRECDRLNAGTCLSCGCYVELRAASKEAHCPKKKW